MTNQALYRKYRPESFSDVVGQDHIVKVLEQEISSDKVSHAYLFYGSRGLGKTTIARILAKEIGTTDDDIYEIDAASNRGIDDIRELREAVMINPYSSRFKVYIIDEVHMLTKEAFNALLKTLEEPPAHVIFMLATTEIGKLPDTIISRCELLTFRRPDEKTLASYLKKVAKKEGFSIGDDVAMSISKNGKGSFRDSLGALQKVLTVATSKDVSEDDVLSAGLHSTSNEILSDLMGSIEASDYQEVSTSLLSGQQKNTLNLLDIYDSLLQLIRDVLLSRLSPKAASSMAEQYGPDYAALVEKNINKKENINSTTLKMLLEYRPLFMTNDPFTVFTLLFAELSENNHE